MLYTLYELGHLSMAPWRFAAMLQANLLRSPLNPIADTEVAPTQGARSVGMVGIHLSNAAPSALADFTIATNDLPAVVDIVDTTCFVFADGFELGDTSGWSATVP